MKALATADLHGYLPEIEPCDLLLIAGDVCPDFFGRGRRPDRGEAAQAYWLNDTFRPWLEKVPAKYIVGIAGNHDFVFDKTQFLIPRALPWFYLRDSSIMIEGLKIYGIPWVPHLPNWAFYLNDRDLRMAYEKVPDDTDVLLSHGPPLGYLDHTAAMYGSRDVGSEAANDAIARVRPQAFVCGHIHEGRGHRVHRSGTDIWNVACNDEVYEEKRPPVEILL